MTNFKKPPVRVSCKYMFYAQISCIIRILYKSSKMSGNSSTPNQGINCDPSYSYVMENFKYFVQVAYLAPAVFLYSRILYVVWVQHKKSYGYHPFFMVYSMVVSFQSNFLN